MSIKRARTEITQSDVNQPEVSITNNQITDASVVSSYDYFSNLETNDNEAYKIITDYRQEIECEQYDDYTIEPPVAEQDNTYVDMTLLNNSRNTMVINTDTYPKISYSIINWLLSIKNLNQINDLTFIPNELLCEFITSKDILIKLLKEQIQNANKMNLALKSFPKITSDYINVFRGFNNAFFDKMTNIINKNQYKQVTFPSFLSTSLFIDAAKRFSGSKKIMSIKIPKGFSLAYVSSSLEQTRDRGVVSEAEVIIPINSTLKLLNNNPVITNDGFTIYQFELIGYVPEVRSFWSNYDNFVNNFGEQIYNQIVNKRGGGKLFKKNKRSTRRKKRKHSLKRKTRRQKRKLTKN
jgi:hypothetical protein